MNHHHVPTAVEATAASKDILRHLHPGRTSINAGEALDGVREVLSLARVLEEIASESPAKGRTVDAATLSAVNWRDVSAKLLHRMRS